MTPRTTPRSRSRSAAACLLAAALTLATACTESDEPANPSQPRAPVTQAGAAPELSVEPAAVTTRVTHVGGTLRATARTRVRTRIGAVVDRWFEAGWVTGRHPRRDYSGAFSVFTPAAAALARRQADVTTNRVLGRELVQVVATVKRVEASVLVPRGTAAGATADVVLVVVGARADGSQVEVVVRGQLFLTATPQGWRVFGFDLRRSQGAPGTYRRGQQASDGDPGPERPRRTRNPGGGGR